jgi:hypothetical protein
VSKKAPIAISYRPKNHDYLPVVVQAIRRFLGDWPIVLLAEAQHLPPTDWLQQMRIDVIKGWAHSSGANKTLRLWEHQEIFAAHFEHWIWWHDDMLLLRGVTSPALEFSRPLVRRAPEPRPNKKLTQWNCALWDTLGFLENLSIPAPNPVLHIPRLIRRDAFREIPGNWNRQRLLFEPTYLLRYWHETGQHYELDNTFRISIFKGAIPDIATLENSDSTILNWGRKIDHSAARAAFAQRYCVEFT